MGGDFHVHINDPDNDEARQLLDAIEALGFNQKVGFCTHKSGNILDLLMTCDINKIMLLVPTSGPFLLGHFTVESPLNIPINPRSLQNTNYQNFKDMDMDKFYCEAKLDKLLSQHPDTENCNLNEFLWKLISRYY